VLILSLTCDHAGSLGIPSDETQIATDLYAGLQKFYALYKDLQNRPLFITGESYAGKYVPALGMLLGSCAIARITSISCFSYSCFIPVMCLTQPHDLARLRRAACSHEDSLDKCAVGSQEWYLRMHAYAVVANTRRLLHITAPDNARHSHEGILLSTSSIVLACIH